MPALAKFVKRIASLFAEKPKLEPDQFELEHILIYHGLVDATAPEERKVKDVKADVELALANESSAQLAITLKLPPQWWEERLTRIFLSLDNHERIVTLLTARPKEDSFDTSNAPLFHEDWMVRANAALLLASLSSNDAIPVIIESMEQSVPSPDSATTNGTALAFPYQARALGQLAGGSEDQSLRNRACKALLPFLSHDNSWIRVDAAAALAEMEESLQCKEFMAAILEPHNHADYLTIMVARKLAPDIFLTSEDPLVTAAGAALTTGVLEGASGTFPPETVVETGVHTCLELLERIVKSKTDPICANAAYNLATWLIANRSYTLLSPPPTDLAENLLDWLKSADFAASLDSWLKESITIASIPAGTKIRTAENTLLYAELRATLRLVRELRIASTAPALSQLLDSIESKSENQGDIAFRDELIETIGNFADSRITTRLLALAHELVDLDERTNRQKSVNPVSESDQAAAVSYWRILAALGKNPQPSAEILDYLILAADDFAPDKRCEALKSAVNVAAKLLADKADSKHKHYETTMEKCLEKSLRDPASSMKKTALQGFRALPSLASNSDNLKKIVDLTSAKETSLINEAFDTLSELAKLGHKEAVVKAIGQGLQTETDIHRRRKLKNMLESMTGAGA